MFPSSFGMTFSVAPEATALRVTCRWGQYQRVASETLVNEKSGNPKLVWRRTPVEGVSPPIPLNDGPIETWVPDPEHPNVYVQGRMRRLGDDWIVSLFLVNNQAEPRQRADQAWLFQPELIVDAPDGAAIFRRRPHLHAAGNGDSVAQAEQHALAMTYRRRVEFAVGHGVAVHVETVPTAPDRAIRIRTRAVPCYEAPKTTPPTGDDVPALEGLVLDMKELAEMEAGAIPPVLAALPDAYAAWIARQRERIDDPASDLEEYRDAATAALDRCERALARIRDGLHLLATDAQAATAFQFMNRAMWLQRTRSLFAEGRRRGGTEDLAAIDVPRNRSWYPFQLAFILINLPGITLLDHAERGEGGAATADLLWFPTGGGKTEAYLGLTAYTLAIRRLQGIVAGHDGENGVAVLMRYTLRLLTLQQFQRASALICACETIRRAASAAGETRWGATPFRIGLWVGQRTTPNTTAQADEAIKVVVAFTPPAFHIEEPEDSPAAEGLTAEGMQRLVDRMDGARAILEQWIRRSMTPGLHYGIIPLDGQPPSKPTLLKPGAELVALLYVSLGELNGVDRRRASCGTAPWARGGAWPSCASRRCSTPTKR
jgi:hypothetical protein